MLSFRFSRHKFVVLFSGQLSVFHKILAVVVKNGECGVVRLPFRDWRPEGPQFPVLPFGNLLHVTVRHTMVPGSLEGRDAAPSIPS